MWSVSIWGRPTAPSATSTPSSRTGSSRRIGFPNGLIWDNWKQEKRCHRFTMNSPAACSLPPVQDCHGNGASPPRHIASVCLLEMPARVIRAVASPRQRAGFRMMVSIEPRTFCPGMGTPMCRGCRRSLRQRVTWNICVLHGITRIRMAKATGPRSPRS